MAVLARLLEAAGAGPFAGHVARTSLAEPTYEHRTHDLDLVLQGKELLTWSPANAS